LDIAARLRLLTALSNLHSPVTQPPHPKFLLLPKRWWSIRTHLVTGVIEITASVAGLVASAVFGASVAPYIRFAAPAGIIHALTALYQTELVFGAKIIMRPAYYCVGYMHLLAAVASACAPERESRLLTQYMVLCIFTWCRVYMTLFRAINIAMPVVYSLSITLAGFTTGTVVLGPLGSARPSCGAPGTCAAGRRATACPSWRRQLPKPDAPRAPSPLLRCLAFLSLSAVLWRWSADIDLYGTEWEELTRERVRSQLFDATAMVRVHVWTDSELGVRTDARPVHSRYCRRPGRACRPTRLRRRARLLLRAPLRASTRTAAVFLMPARRCS
jgi:hypothetical protein